MNAAIAPSVDGAGFGRRMLPFVAVQAAFTSLGGFAGVFVQAEHGSAAVMRYAAVMLGTTALVTVLAYAGGRLLSLTPRRLVQLGFALPALLLPFADGRPDLLALAFGLFLGATWGARHAFELQRLDDAARDAYASHAVPVAVASALAMTLAMSLLLATTNEQRVPVLLAYAVLGLAGAAVVGGRLPALPPLALEDPRTVLREPGYRRCLPLFFLESGLLGIGMVMQATGAVQALGDASHFGWAASAATLAGAVALRALRHRRHAGNRAGWMGAACVGMVLSAALLAASPWWPALFVLHLLLHASVHPFWSASELVLNQRVMDLRGALGDRIVVREATLGVFRLLALALFWAAAAALDDRQRLVAGAALVGAAAALEYAWARRWLI